jgi:sugar (pentulose or hexulose) kinase
VIAPLAELGELTGPRLRAALVTLGFVLGDHVDAPLTVLAGNPHFDPDSWCRSLAPTVIGLADALSGADVRAAALEGSCYAIGSVLASLTSRVALHPPYVVATGGMSTSSRWCQSLADVTGHEVRVRPLDKIAGLGGAALVSGEDAQDLASGIEFRCFRTNPRTTSGHRRGHAAYERLYRTLQDERHDLRTAADACLR